MTKMFNSTFPGFQLHRSKTLFNNVRVTQLVIKSQKISNFRIRLNSSHLFNANLYIGSHDKKNLGKNQCCCQIWRQKWFNYFLTVAFKYRLTGGTPHFHIFCMPNFRFGLHAHRWTCSNKKKKNRTPSLSLWISLPLSGMRTFLHNCIWLLNIAGIDQTLVYADFP